MQKNPISKNQLYESVKLLVEAKADHLQLSQHKLYTLVSIAFQYLLFMSTKKPGYYIIRCEDHYVLDKLIRKAKDLSTKKFLDKLSHSRRLKYGKSTFFLDYFQMSSWAQTNDLPKERVQGALIIKNAGPTPFADSPYLQEVQKLQEEGMDIGEHHYLTMLQKVCPKTISIAYETPLPNCEKIEFPFIKREEDERSLNGVKIAKDLQFED